MNENSQNGFVGANSQMLKPPDIGAEAIKAFNRATKIGVFKELHKKELLGDHELTVLIAKTR